MMNERITDLYIYDLLKMANIEIMPNGSNVKEINDALKSASKKGTGNAGYPEYVGLSNDFVIIIENKFDINYQAKYTNEEKNMLLMTNESIIKYAENGALHYAQHIINNTSFKNIFAFGCSGNSNRHKIRPIYVNREKYILLKDVDNFENFNEKNIKKYYKEQILKEIAIETIELEEILKKAQRLHEDLRNYGQLGDSEKPLVVSAILLALCEKTFSIDTLIGDNIKTDGQKIFEALSTYMDRVEVQPNIKKDRILNQFTIIKDRVIINQIDNKLKDKNNILGKTPLKYFTEYINTNVLEQVKSNSTEDILGRFYGEFMSYSGGDGQTLGVVLTPNHITELFCELVEIKPTDIIFDPCCGTGGFLIAGMNYMINIAKTKDQINEIKKNQIHGIEIREDMFSIATTNMILRGDGKSNLLCEDFLKTDIEELRKNNFSIGFINPPYSQAKNKETEYLSEIHFIKHLLNSLKDGGRCVAIIPQSTMVGKNNEDKKVKKEILKFHTLEGVITLNKDTFYGVGVNTCIAVFTAHRPHPKNKYCKFINYEDDGFITYKHIGLIETERAKERKKHLLSCWLYDAPAESKFMVKNTIEAEDEWLHSFYYFNDEIPMEEDFINSMADYLTFEFNMITHGKKYLFEEED